MKKYSKAERRSLHLSSCIEMKSKLSFLKDSSIKTLSKCVTFVEKYFNTHYNHTGHTFSNEKHLNCIHRASQFVFSHFLCRKQHYELMPKIWKKKNLFMCFSPLRHIIEFFMAQHLLKKNLNNSQITMQNIVYVESELHLSFNHLYMTWIMVWWWLIPDSEPSSLCDWNCHTCHSMFCSWVILNLRNQSTDK